MEGVKSTDDSKYTLIRHAITFIAYETNWSITRTVDWLLARDFERDISAYEKIDGSYYKINNKEAGFDTATKYLLKQVTTRGLSGLSDEKKGFHKAYYRIDDLNDNVLLDRLDLNFHQIYNYTYNIDIAGYVTALNYDLCDIANKHNITITPTPAVRPAKPDLLEQYQIELEQLASNNCEAIKQKNIQLDINLTTANEKIAGLENKLAQAKAELANTPVNSAIDDGQGDTLLILGAVMDCIKDVAKPNYTQQSLITAIMDKYKNTPSLSASTLTKKFPLAKKHLNQRVTS